MEEGAAVQRAVTLSWATILWNLAEGAVSIAFGLGERSLSLLGFGLDSLIEVAAAALVLWRLRAEAEGRLPPSERERRATLGIGLLLLALGLGTGASSLFALARGDRPRSTVPGLAVSLVCGGVMLGLWRAKAEVGRALNSPTVMKDAACSLACAQLSGAVLLGSAAFAASPRLWWADSAAAAALAVLFAREGREAAAAARRADFAGGCGCRGG